jgi:serine/threonine protein kinase
MIGQMLGPYQILSKVGEGGMDEICKARDTRLDRTVGAGKVLFAIEERQASIVVGERIRPPRSRGEELVSHER